MKKHITIIFLFHFFFLFSQKGIVEYGYVESLGLGNAQGLDYNSMLIFDQNYSNYVTGKESLEKIEKITETKKVEVDGEVIAVFNGLGVTKEGNQVFYSKKDRFMLSTLYFKEVFYINDSIVNINWKITKETKKIGKFNCKKATTNFRGRKYIAWYTIDIPVSYGPWKLQGLPGLILEAYDTDKFVYWYFKNIDYPTNSKDEVVFWGTGEETRDFIHISDVLYLFDILHCKSLTFLLQENYTLNKFNSRKRFVLVTVHQYLD